MSASTKTSLGHPDSCPICGPTAIAEPPSIGSDQLCPECAKLLEWFKSRAGGPTKSDNITPDTDLTELASDSLETAELLMTLQEEFDVHIPDADLPDITTIGEAIRYVRTKKSKG